MSNFAFEFSFKYKNPPILCIPIHKSSTLLINTSASTPSHSSSNLSTTIFSRTSPKSNSAEQIIQASPTDNHYITENLLFDDSFIDLSSPSLRIIFTNVNGLELSFHSSTLETICDYMYLNNVDVTYMFETNSHWKNQRYYNMLYNFWKLFHLSTSETKTKTPWPTIVKPGETATITPSTLCIRISSSGEDPHGLGR